MLVIAISMFLLSFLLLSKLIKILLSSSLQERHRSWLSSDLPRLPWLTPYMWLLAGVGATVLVQSSTIITSALVPLVSSKIITLGLVKYSSFALFCNHDCSRSSLFYFSRK